MATTLMPYGRVFDTAAEALAAESTLRGDKAIHAEGLGGFRVAFGDPSDLPESDFGWYEISLRELDRLAEPGGEW